MIYFLIVWISCSFFLAGWTYNDGYLKRKGPLSVYHSSYTRWFRLFGFGLYYSKLIGFKFLR